MSGSKTEQAGEDYVGSMGQDGDVTQGIVLSDQGRGWWQHEAASFTW